MRKQLSFYNENELLTVEEQKIQESQQDMSFVFGIGLLTCVVLGILI